MTELRDRAETVGLALTPQMFVPTMATIESVRSELFDTVTLGMNLPPPLDMPAPGQFAMMWIPGVGEVAISYSAVGPERRVEHTIRAVGMATSALVALQPGDEVGLRGPFGNGWQLDQLAERDLIIVGGGLGLAPLRPVIDAAAEHRLPTRSVRVFMGARDPESLLYALDIDDRWGELDVHVSVDSAPASWRGAVGPVTNLLDGQSLDAGAVALACGPEIMMEVASKKLTEAGLDPRNVQISLERNMQCGLGHCGRCQLGPLFTCTDGPVVDWTVGEPVLAVRER